MIIIYCILIPLTVLKINNLHDMTPRNDSIVSYIPKRKRGNIYKLDQWMKKRVNDMYKRMIAASESIKINRKIRQRIVTAKKLNHSTNRIHCKEKYLHQIMAWSVVAMVAGQNNKLQIKQQRSINFDTDSEQVGIDNRCSACISHKIEDFIGTPVRTKRTIKGFGGAKVSNIMKGTIKWKWCDDYGKIHSFKIPNSYYIPEGGVRLLSPQHWAQEQRKSNRKKGTHFGCDTSHNVSILYWDKGHKLTVPIDPSNNVATFILAPGFGKFRLFCEKAEINYENECDEPMIYQPVEMEDDEESNMVESDMTSELQWPDDYNAKNMNFDIDEKGKAESSLNTNGSDHKMTDKSDNVTAELLELHQRYGHISFKRLIEMARQGIIHKKYSKCQIPTCSSCLFAKATKKKWRDKKRSQYTVNNAMVPGECVSVDQLVSPTPGLVAQMTGILTTRRYKYATVFVDQATKLGYVHLQTSADADETLKAKRSFEEYALQHGVQIRSYHADNGIFRANKWVHAEKVSSH